MAPKMPNTHGYSNISLLPNGKWGAYASINNNKTGGGTWDTAREAAHSHDW